VGWFKMNLFASVHPFSSNNFPSFLIHASRCLGVIIAP